MKSIPTVEFDTSRLTAGVLSDLEADVRSIDGVADQNFDELYEVIVQGLAKGGDLAMISAGLQRLVPRMNFQKAAVLSRWFWAKVVIRAQIERLQSLHIEKVIWQYSNAPCFDPHSATEEDRERDKAHRSADGKKFKAVLGLKVNGEMTWPGVEPDCRCSMRAVIPGFE